MQYYRKARSLALSRAHPELFEEDLISVSSENMITHNGLVMPYGDLELDQHWLRYGLVAWQHQAITWTTVDLSSLRFGYIHLRAILCEISQPSITKITFEINHQSNWNCLHIWFTIFIQTFHESILSFAFIFPGHESFEACLRTSLTVSITIFDTCPIWHRRCKWWWWWRWWWWRWGRQRRGERTTEVAALSWQRH